MRIATLLVRHGTDRYPDALAHIQTLFRQQLGSVRHEIVVIDNAEPPGHVECCGPDLSVIGGDNSSWEFSGWDCGVRWLGPRLHGFDLVHLATSAFRQLYIRYLDRFGPPMLDALRGRAGAAGHIDYGNDPVVLRGIASRCWLRSSFVFLPPTELALLGSLVSIADGGAFFSGDAAAPFRLDAPLSKQYQRNVTAWLCGEGLGQGVTWHSRFNLTPATLGYFEQKVRAILNEQMLSSRLRAQGCALVDATWLATLCESAGTAGRFRGAWPSWREQLAHRDTDAVPALLAGA